MATRTLDKQIGTVRNDLDRLSQDVRSIAKVLTEATTGQVEQVKGRVIAAAEQARKDVERLSDEAQAHGRAKLKELGETVEARPIASLAVAFAAGILLGKLLNR